MKKIKSNSEKLMGCLQNIQRSRDSRHIEQVPYHEIRAPRVNNLPVHIATHPKKDRHRVVVDPNSNRKEKGINEALLTGANLIN